MHILEILQWFMFVPVNTIQIFYILNQNLTIKSNNIFLKYGYPLAFILLSSSMYFYDIYWYNDKTKIIMNVFLILYLILAFKEKWTKKLYILTCMFVIFGVSEAIVCLVIILSGLGMIYPTEISIRALMIQSGYDFITFVMLSLFTRFNLRKNSRKNNNGFEWFLLVPFSQLFLAESLCANYDDGVLSKQNLFLFSLGMFVSLITDILLFRAIRLIQDSEKNKEKLRSLKYKQEVEAAYYENIQKSIEQTMKYRHDINNMLTTAYNMANSQNEKTAKESIRFLDELRAKNELLNMPVYSSNPVINAVIQDKKGTADEMNIDFETHIEIPQNMDISLTDLCSIFSNLIDNAFKAAGKSENKKVILNAWYDIGYLFVKTKNHAENTEDSAFKKKHSIMDEHGYGIEIMKDISEKYDGEFSIKIDGDCVNSACSMRYTGLTE